MIGVLQLLVGLGIWAGNQLARWAGVIVVSLNMIAQLLFIPAYPFWSLAIFTVDVLIIYGLVAYGGRPSPGLSPAPARSGSAAASPGRHRSRAAAAPPCPAGRARPPA